jgi:hypothetical protein
MAVVRDTMRLRVNVVGMKEVVYNRESKALLEAIHTYMHRG